VAIRVDVFCALLYLQLTNNWNGDGAHHIEGLLTRTMNDGFHG